ALRHAAPRALRPRALPRGPGVPGDRRPHEFPGTVRPPSSLHRAVRLPRGPPVQGRSSPASRGGGEDPGFTHRGEPRIDPRPDGGQRRLVETRRGRRAPEVVGAAVGLAVRPKEQMMNPLSRPLGVGLVLSMFAALSPLTAHAFCGFYVARGDAKLY